MWIFIIHNFEHSMTLWKLSVPVFIICHHEYNFIVITVILQLSLLWKFCNYYLSRRRAVWTASRWRRTWRMQLTRRAFVNASWIYHCFIIVVNVVWYYSLLLSSGCYWIITYLICRRIGACDFKCVCVECDIAVV